MFLVPLVWVLLVVSKAAAHSCTLSQYCVLENARLVNDTILVKGVKPLEVKAVERGDNESRIVHIQNDKVEGGRAAHVRPSLFLLKDTYFAGNIGHVLGDDIFVVWTRLFSLGGLFDVTVLLSDAADGPSLASRRGNIIREHYQLVTDRPLVLLHDDPTGATAYGRLIVGWDRLTYAIRGRDDDVVPLMPLPLVEAFRRRALAYAGLPLAKPVSHCDVLIVEKNASVAEHVYNISNTAALVAALRRVPGCRVQVAQWAGVSLRRQIALVAHRPIVVALPGSDVMNCIFQPTHSGMLLPHRCSAAAGCEDSNEVSLWFSKLPHRHVMQFPRDEVNLVWHGSSLTWRVAHFLAAVRVMVNRLKEVQKYAGM